MALLMTVCITASSASEWRARETNMLERATTSPRSSATSEALSQQLDNTFKESLTHISYAQQILFRTLGSW